MAYVITDECVACGTCAEACPAEAISEGDGKYVIDADVNYSFVNHIVSLLALFLVLFIVPLIMKTRMIQ